MSAIEVRPDRSVLKSGGRQFPSAEEFAAVRGRRLDAETIERLDLNLRALWNEPGEGDPVAQVSEEDLGRLLVLADMAESDGEQMIEWARSIRKRAFDLYWNQ